MTEEIMEFINSYQIYCLVILMFKADICVSNQLIAMFCGERTSLHFVRATGTIWVTFENLTVDMELHIIGREQKNIVYTF